MEQPVHLLTDTLFKKKQFSTRYIGLQFYIASDFAIVEGSILTQNEYYYQDVWKT